MSQDDSAAAETAVDRAVLVRDAVGAWQRHLVDLGGRNTLLWFRDLPSGTLDLTRAHPAGTAQLFSTGSALLRLLVREPIALAEAERRARVIRSRTESLQQERGIASCYLAIGMATWDHPGAPRRPCAPVLLRRLEISGSAKDPRELVLRLDSQLEFNSVFATYIEVEHGIALDVTAVDGYLSDTTDADPGVVLAQVQEACAEIRGFRVERRYVAGTFSYTKLPMVRDLGDQIETLSAHPVIAALAGDAAARVEVAADIPPAVDRDPVAERLVLDADSSQQDVIEAARAGAHLVVEGPPGTGKSQTIANLIAALAADGRRVLFVAEKRAAIEAVVKRLDRLGLGDLVLDVHEGVANRDGLSAELVAMMDRLVESDPPPGAATGDLTALRDGLAAHRLAMHDIRSPWGVSVNEAQSKVAGFHAMRPAPRSHAGIDSADLDSMSESRRDELRAELVEAVELGAWRTDDEPDPWYAARVVGVQQAARTEELVTRLADGGLQEHRDALAELTDRVGLPRPASMLESESQLELMTDAHRTLETFRPEIFAAPLGALVYATGSGAYRKSHPQDMSALDRRRLRKQTRTLLRPGQPPADMHGVLVLAAGQQERWRKVAGKGSRPSAPVNVPRFVAAHEHLREELEWLADRLEGTAEGNKLLDLDFDALQDRLERLAGAKDRLALVPTVIGTLDRLRANGLGELLDDLAARRVPPSRVGTEFEFVWWRAVLSRIAQTDTRYGEADGVHLREAVSSYAAADAQHVRAGADGVRAAWVDQVRRTLRDLPEQETLLREQARAPRQRPLRELLPQAPELLTTVKPCWAMSPLLVASMLPMGVWFDVVVFDEASQIPPAEAISAISRGGQVVIAGDRRQLPPTSFFRGVDESDETSPVAAESILDALSPLLPHRELSWHYRALDERLISFANAQLYAGRLVTFPGVGDDAVVRLDVVTGRAGDGPATDGSATDGSGSDGLASEVDRVVRVVLDQARNRPDESIGVITFSQRHADRVEAAIRDALTDEPDLFHLWDDSVPEPFFVKNLERVQGDERDAIVLSVGFPRSADGSAPHRFGPISAEGGERRLNVAITRARRRMVMVSSFSGDELHPGKLRSRGGLLLRDFLLFAASGGAARRVHSDVDGGCGSDELPAESSKPRTGVVRGPDGRRRRAASSGSVLDRPMLPPMPEVEVPVLVRDLARRLRAEGLVVHPGWGASQHRLDLAVEDPLRPGSLLVAIETDGAVYGSIDSTRDRERLRVEQLRRLGWSHERVWTRDLFRDPAREVARLAEAVHAASRALAGDRLETAHSRAANPWLDDDE